MKATEKKAIEYKAVLDSNKALKENCKTLGYALKLISECTNVHAKLKEGAKELQKKGNEAKYKECAENCRKTKDGKFTPFYVLQYLYKGL
jgi:hypothetical protein